MLVGQIYCTQITAKLAHARLKVRNSHASLCDASLLFVRLVLK